MRKLISKIAAPVRTAGNWSAARVAGFMRKEDGPTAVE